MQTVLSNNKENSLKFQTLGQILVGKNIVKQSDLEFCFAIQQADKVKRKIGHYLVEHNFACERDIAQALSEASGYKFFCGEYVPNMEVVKEITVQFLEDKKIFPLLNDGKIIFILTAIYDTETTDYLQSKFGLEIEFYVAEESEIIRAIEAIIRETSKEDVGKLFSVVDDVTADKLAVEILEYAVAASASDIHIEPAETVVEIRLRVDGVMQFYRILPIDMLNKLTNVFFHLSSIQASDFMQFHDNRFDFEFLGHHMDVRLSHLPGGRGSGLCLRLLDQNQSAKSLQSLGYAEAHWNLLSKAMTSPNGIILMTGPTGCGKSTSLYAIINSLKGINRKILSVEDPIEVRLSLVTQVPVDLKKGHTFAVIARAFLRHDPDIILIGEIRDSETAQVAIQASGTGHLVFSTLHTNDPVSALLRLRDLSVDYSNIANNVRCIVSQRLVRKLCVCKDRKRVNRSQLNEFTSNYLTHDEQDVFVPVGCRKCSGVGYLGRTVIGETLFIDDEIQKLVAQGNVHGIGSVLKERGSYLTIKNDARRLVKESVLSLDEAVRILG